MVPPVVNLKEFGVIGVIAFASNAEGNVPEEKYGQLVDEMIAHNTRDFRPSHYYRTSSR